MKDVKNKLIIAAAGSGKTTFLVKKALSQKEGNILITTYTQNNEAAIKEKIISLNKCIPKNITVQAWFSFLLEHGVKPYQGHMLDEDINGLLLVNQRSGRVYPNKNIYYSEDRFEHYFSPNLKIYSDKLSKFVCKCNEASNGEVIRRLSRIYSHIYIDEVQDLAGYDLEILRLLFQSKSSILLVGDPRQVTYLTHNEQKYCQYQNGLIKKFIIKECKDTLPCNIDEDILNYSYRNNQIICDFASKLYANDFSPVKSKNIIATGHDGIFLVRTSDLDKYLSKYKPIQLRWDARNNHIDTNYKYYNFGASKGMEFDRVLIYPTDPIKKWFRGKYIEFENTSRTKLYVAITRAKHSVAFLYDYKPEESFIEGIVKYNIM